MSVQNESNQEIDNSQINTILQKKIRYKQKDYVHYKNI